MRILLVHPAAEVSISDVSRGYRSALERQGHDIRDYYLNRRIAYHMKAMPPEIANDPAMLARQASENVVNEAMYHGSDIVLVISGLNLHPIALWLLGRIEVPVAVIFTESPYNDDHQAQWADLSHVGGHVNLIAFTNDKHSANTRGWHYLPPAFDPEIHHPVPKDPSEVCDVLIVGTGWAERQQYLEAVDWNGIDLRIYGVWPNIDAGSKIHRFYHPQVVDNARIASLYCSARICLNLHRQDPNAYTPGPRAYEIAACGGFQISDRRPGIIRMFDDNVPMFDDPQHLGKIIREYLACPGVRTLMAAECRKLVQNETFDRRAADLVAVLSKPAETAGRAKQGVM